MAVLGEAAPLCEPKALGVVVVDDRLDRVEPTLAGPGRDGHVERGADPSAAVLGEHRHERGNEPGPLRLDRSDRGAADGAVDPSEEIDVVELTRPVGTRLLEADAVLRPDRVVDVEPTLLVRLVRIRGDLDHTTASLCQFRSGERRS